jgi:hypothetical protein
VSASAKIIQLQELLAARGLTTVERPRERFLAGWAGLDAAAGGGLPKGDLAELNCRHGGAALAVAELLQAAERQRHFVALLDGSDSFDLESVSPAALARLLWVRCRNATEAVKAADLVLRDGNLPLVVLNLRSCTDVGRIPSQAWYRLQRIVEQSGCTLVVLTPRPSVTSARVRLTLHRRFSMDDLDRELTELVEGVTFEATRVQGARVLPEETLMAEVG